MAARVFTAAHGLLELQRSGASLRRGAHAPGHAGFRSCDADALLPRDARALPGPRS